jgi:hypothetical protein
MTGISEIANTDKTKRYDGNTWLCPLCEQRCAYGEMGCKDPLSCDSVKNVHFKTWLKRNQKAPS